MSTVKIRIVQQQHFVEGDKFMVFLEQENDGIMIAYGVKQQEYLQLCEKLDGLRWRLEDLGNTVVIKNEFEPDPNFSSYEEAMEHLENMEKDMP